MARGSYSYVSDPGWNYRHLEMVTQLLDAWSRRRQMDKEKSERQTFDALNAAMQAVSSGKMDPRDPGAVQALDRAAKLHPEVAGVARGIFDASAGRLDTAKKADDAYNTLTRRAEEEQRAMELLQLLGGRGGPAGMMGSAAGPIGEQRNAAPLGEKLQRAMQGMPVGQQLLALPQLKDAGVDMNVAAPSPFDKYGGDLPQNLSALEAAREGLVGGDTAQGAKYAARLERTPQELAAEGQQLLNRDLQERRLRLGQKREARMARGGGGAGEKEARAEAKERQDLIGAAAKGIRQGVLDQRTMAKDAAPQGAKAKASTLPPIPNFRDARREAVRQEAAALSPRLQGALEALGGMKEAVAEQLSTAGAVEVLDRAGKRPGGGAMAQNERLRAVLPAIEKAETAALDMVAAGKDPDVVAGFLEELLGQLQP